MSINKSLLVLAAVAVLSSSAAFAAAPVADNGAMTSAPQAQKHLAKKDIVKAKTSKKVEVKKDETVKTK